MAESVKSLGLMLGTVWLGLCLFWSGFKETWGGGAVLITIAVFAIIVCVILIEVFG